MYKLTDSERLNELNIQINMLLAQSEITDNPYTNSEYRALMHQIDRITIKRDILLDRINLQREKEENKEENKEKYSVIEYIIIISIYILYLIFLKIMISL